MCADFFFFLLFILWNINFLVNTGGWMSICSKLNCFSFSWLFFSKTILTFCLFVFSGSTSLNSTLSRSNFEINHEDSLAVQAQIHNTDINSLQVSIKKLYAKKSLFFWWRINILESSSNHPPACNICQRMPNKIQKV